MIPEINIGMIGHVEHGKTSLLKSLTDKWSSTHSEEKKRGLTIRLGYSSVLIHKCSKGGEFTKMSKCLVHNCDAIPFRMISFVDAPGHEALMATMLSGASVMDAAILVIAANEKCPQPQTREHLMALNILDVKRVIIVQNKIDLINDERALESFNDIKKFVKGSVAENAPIIPMSALHEANLDVLLEAINEFFPKPVHDLSKPALMLVSRSFDVNKPGTFINDFKGGVIGGVLKQGKLKVNDEVIILPGVKVVEKNVTKWVPVRTVINSIFYGEESVSEALPGGNFGASTLLDSSLTQSDSFAGCVACADEGVVSVFFESIDLMPELMGRVVGTSAELRLDPLKINEQLMINALTAKTVGVITKVSPKGVSVSLKLPVAVPRGEKVAISRFIQGTWRLVGNAIVL